MEAHVAKVGRVDEHDGVGTVAVEPGEGDEVAATGEHGRPGVDGLEFARFGAARLLQHEQLPLRVVEERSGQPALAVDGGVQGALEAGLGGEEGVPVELGKDSDEASAKPFAQTKIAMMRIKNLF